MKHGRDPAEVTAKVTPYVGTPVDQLELLRVVTGQLIRPAGSRYERFRPQKLWDLVRVVQLWSAGYRSDANLVEAEHLLTEARLEHARLIEMALVDFRAESRIAESKGIKTDRITRSDKRVLVLSRLEALANGGPWGWTLTKIAKGICSPRYIERLINVDSEVKAAWKNYRQQSIDNGPIGGDAN
jgi:hypothetical protein